MPALAIRALLVTLLAAAPAASRDLHFEYEDGRYYVPVAADSAGTRIPLGWFVLDTGVPQDALDESVARRLHLKVTPQGTQTGAGSGSSRIGTAKSPALHVDGVGIPSGDVIVLPIDEQLAPSSGRHVAGIVGAPLFESHAVEIDRGRNLMRIDPPNVATGADLPEAGRQRVRFALEGGNPVVSATLAVPGADSAETSLKLIVDLGAKSALLLTEPLLARLGGEARLGPHVLASLGAGVGGETRYHWARAGALRLLGADAPLADSLVVGWSALGTLKSADFDGLLGAPMLDHFAVLFDYATKTLWLAPRSDGVTPPAPLMGFDASGLFLLREGDKVVIHRVVTGSPAADAGIAEGDELLSVDGAVAATARLSELRHTLRAVGRRVVIAWRHAGEPKEAVLELRRLF